MSKIANILSGFASGGYSTEQAVELIENHYNPPAEETVHVVTEEDLTTNPELAEAGIKVDDAISIPAGDSEASPEPTEK